MPQSWESAESSRAQNTGSCGKGPFPCLYPWPYPCPRPEPRPMVPIPALPTSPCSWCPPLTWSLKIIRALAAWAAWPVWAGREWEGGCHRAEQGDSVHLSNNLGLFVANRPAGLVSQHLVSGCYFANKVEVFLAVEGALGWQKLALTESLPSTGYCSELRLANYKLEGQILALYGPWAKKVLLHFKIIL